MSFTEFAQKLFSRRRTLCSILLVFALAQPGYGIENPRGFGVDLKVEKCESFLRRSGRLVRANKVKVGLATVAALLGLRSGANSAQEWNETRIARNQVTNAVLPTAPAVAPQVQRILDLLLMVQTPMLSDETPASDEPRFTSRELHEALANSEYHGLRRGFENGSEAEFLAAKREVLSLVATLSISDVKVLIATIFSEASDTYISRRVHSFQRRPLVSPYRRGVWRRMSDSWDETFREEGPEPGANQIRKAIASSKRRMAGALAFLFVATHQEMAVPALIELEELSRINWPRRSEDQSVFTEGYFFDDSDEVHTRINSDAPHRYSLRFARVLSLEGGRSLTFDEVVQLTDGIDAQARVRIVSEYLSAHLEGRRGLLSFAEVQGHLALLRTIEGSRGLSPLMNYVWRLISNPLNRLDHRGIMSIFMALERQRHLNPDRQGNMDRAGSTTTGTDRTQGEIAERKMRLWEFYFAGLSLQTHMTIAANDTPDEIRRLFREFSEMRDLDWWQTHLNELRTSGVVFPDFLEPALVFAIDRELRTTSLARLLGALPHVAVDSQRALLANYLLLHPETTRGIRQLSGLIAGISEPTTRLAFAEALVERRILRTSRQVLEVSSMDSVGPNFLLYVLAERPQLLRSSSAMQEVIRIFNASGQSVMRDALKILTTHWRERGMRRFFPLALASVTAVFDPGGRYEDHEIRAFLWVFQSGASERQRRLMAAPLERSPALYYPLIFRP